MGGTVAALVVAALVKAPCLFERWDGAQYEDLCYNDLQPLYASRSLDQHVVPYIGAPGRNRDGSPKGFLEYPVLTGLVLYVAALPATSDESFFVWNAAILSIFAVGTTILLYTMVHDPRRVAFFAAGPPLVLYAFHNWDLIAVFLATLGFHSFVRGRWVLSGAAFGLGAAAKIYPGFFVPVLGLVLLRDEWPKFERTARLVGAAGGSFVLLNLPFAIINPSLWWRTYDFHLDRGASYESPWFALLEYADRLGVLHLDFAEARTLQAVVALPLFAGLAAWLAWRIWNRRIPAVAACLTVLLGFLLVNKVWSVQYTLWILPFFAFMPLGPRKLATLEATDLAVYVTVFPFLLHIGSSDEPPYYDRLAWAVAFRTAAVTWLLVHALTRRASAPPPSGAPTAKPRRRGRPIPR